MTKRIRVFNTPEELVESAKKNAEYWLQKGVTFAFGRFGDAFMISPTDENGNQSGNASQMFFESHELCGRFFENFRMVVAHTPGKIRGSRMGDMYQRIVFVPKKRGNGGNRSDGIRRNERNDIGGRKGMIVRFNTPELAEKRFKELAKLRNAEIEDDGTPSIFYQDEEAGFYAV